MTTSLLRTSSKEVIFEYIRETLSIENSDRRRFDMSGYGNCTVGNTEILNLFSSLGIYDYTKYLFIDFYKGHGTLYLNYFFAHDLEDNLQYDLSGHTTTEIIYEIFQRTIFSGEPERRRY
jgi:hypothetical protein